MSEDSSQVEKVSSPTNSKTKSEYESFDPHTSENDDKKLDNKFFRKFKNRFLGDGKNFLGPKSNRYGGINSGSRSKRGGKRKTRKSKKSKRSKRFRKSRSRR